MVLYDAQPRGSPRPLQRRQSKLRFPLVRYLSYACIDCDDNRDLCSVNLKVTSVATYLPHQSQDDDVPFGSVVGLGGRGRPHPTPTEEALGSARQIEELKEDAIARKLAWSTEDDADLSDLEADADPDAEGEVDPDYLENITSLGLAQKPCLPVGQRKDGGEIEPVDFAKLQAAEMQQEALFVGIDEPVPRELKEMVRALDCDWLPY